MPFVIKRDNGNYVTGMTAWRNRYGEGDPDLQKARVFKRRCDASNSFGGEIVEVKLVEATPHE